MVFCFGYHLIMVAEFICTIANGGQTPLDGIPFALDGPDVGVAVPNLSPRTRLLLTFGNQS